MAKPNKNKLAKIAKVEARKKNRRARAANPNTTSPLERILNAAQAMLDGSGFHVNHYKDALTLGSKSMSEGRFNRLLVDQTMKSFAYDLHVTSERPESRQAFYSLLRNNPEYFPERVEYVNALMDGCRQSGISNNLENAAYQHWQSLSISLLNLATQCETAQSKGKQGKFPEKDMAAMYGKIMDLKDRLPPVYDMLPQA